MNLLQRLLKGPWLPPQQSNSAYAWLLMLVIFYLKYFQVPVAPAELALAALTTLGFLALYFTNFWIEGPRSFGIVTSIALLGLLWAPFNGGASVFIVFAAACCASILNPRAAYLMVALILVAVAVESVWLNLRADFWVPGLLVTVAIGTATIMQTSLRRSQRRLLRSQEEAAYLATIAERERISRDLHDLLGHTLSMITLKAELAGKLIERDRAAAANEIRDIEQTARQALAEVRAAVSGYRSVGLAHELAHANSSLAAADINLTTQIQPLALPAALENVLCLTVREAITNVLRHSRADQCRIELRAEPQSVLLQIADNGTPAATATHRAGNGLTGMRERVNSAGGELLVNREQGFMVQIRLPFIHQENNP